MRQTTTPRIESLEARTMPAVFGVPWPDARHLTVSFVAQGTLLGPSWVDASGTVHPAVPSAVPALSGTDWQREVLRALQTWGVEADIDFTVVADSGDPLGTPGAPQGDPRFGDIRVVWASLGSGSVASSVPYSPNAGTWSGDLFLDPQAGYQIGSGAGYDLFTIALHEAGHILGVEGNLTDLDSPLFEYYTGPKSGLGTSEISALQDLYGARTPDRYESGAGNETLARATPFTAASEEDAGEGLLSLVADRTTETDVDVYSYRTTGADPGFTVRLSTTDLSLLNARLTVLDALGRVVATATGPGDSTLRIEAAPRQRFFFRVEGGESGAFGIGGYRLSVDPDATPGRCRHDDIAERFQQRLCDNDGLRSATRLFARPATGNFTATGRIDRGGDVDFYRLRLPVGAGSLSVLLTGTGWLNLAVLDERGRVLARDSGQGNLHLRLENLAEGRNYYLAVTGESGATYRLVGCPEAPETPSAVVATGSLTSSTPQAFRGLYLGTTELVRLDIALTNAVGAAVEVALFDLQGRMVYRQLVNGAGMTATLHLAKGAYTLRLVGGMANGSTLPSIGFSVQSRTLSDPIGPQLIDPTLIPPREVVDAWFGNGFYVELAIVDPFGRPLNLMDPPPIAQLP